MRRIRRGVGTSLVAVAAVFSAPGVAAAAPPVTETFKGHKVQFIEPGTPGVCDGQPGTLTETVNFVIHSTTGPRISNVKVHVTSRFVFVYDDVTRPTYTGRYTFNSTNIANGGVTIERQMLNARSVGSDGSTETFHMNVAVVTAPDGTIRSEVSNIRCRVS